MLAFVAHLVATVLRTWIAIVAPGVLHAHANHTKVLRTEISIGTIVSAETELGAAGSRNEGQNREG